MIQLSSATGDSGSVVPIISASVFGEILDTLRTRTREAPGQEIRGRPSRRSAPSTSRIIWPPW
jgi:hypothetical protein